MLTSIEWHMLRHDKRDEEAGGPGLGVLKTRKRTRRAHDGTIIVHPSQREIRSAARSSISSGSSVQELTEEHESFIGHGPLSPPGSGADRRSIAVDENDDFIAPMMPGGPFEPFVEPVPGQFDAADGSFNVGLDGLGDLNGMDTGTGYILPNCV